MVVDAGWFGGGFPNGVGNWDEIDAKRFPDGVGAFSQYVRSKKLQYGTWFEPEFAHVNSSVYRTHPEWFVPVDPVARLLPHESLMTLGLIQNGGLGSTTSE